MENHIIVSVIIPVYNTAPYLEECLESACKQMLKSLEIICVDDGSTDKSLSILKKFADQDSRIRVISQANQGASHARNVGIQQAQGKFIYFLDSDDYLVPEALETLVNTMEARELELLLFNANVFGEGGVEENRLQNEKGYFRRVHEYPTVCKGEDLFRRLIENQEYTASVPVQLTKSTFLKDNSLSFYEEFIHEDELFVFECLLLASKAGYINKSFYYRRVRQNSVMDLRQSEKLTFSVFSLFSCVKQMLKFCDSAEWKKGNEEAVFSNLERMIGDCRERYERLDEAARIKLLEMAGKDKFLFKSLIVAPYEDRASIRCLQAAVKQRDETLRMLEAERREKEALQNELAAIKTSRGFRFLTKYYQARILIRKGISMLLHGNRTTEKSEIFPSANQSKQDLTQVKTELAAKITEQNNVVFLELLKTGDSESRNTILSDWYFQMTGESIDLNCHYETENSVLLVEFNDWHGECIPGFYKYLSELNFTIDCLVSDSVYKEKALAAVECRNAFHGNIELMALLLQYALIDRYKIVIFNSNAFLWPERENGKWFTVLEAFPYLRNYLDKIYVLEHQLEFLDQTLLEMGHVFVLTDKLPLDKRLIPVNCHWFGERCLSPKNKVTRFISVGTIVAFRKNFDLLLKSVEFLYDQGIRDFHVTIVGLGTLEHINEKIRPYVSVLGRVSYSDVCSEMKESDFLLTLLDPENPDHDRYITRGTSGSFQLIYGFSKPCLIAEKFADVYGFSSENAVVYMGNNDLGAAMQKAIAMTDVEYDRMRNNLISMSRAIYNQSFANLKRALGNSINTGDNICPLKKETPERKIALENGIPSSKRITTYDDRVTLINYWTADPSVCNRDWLYRFVKNNTDIKHLNIFSIFGKKEYIEKYATKNDVFYSGENLDVKHGMYDEYCDYCLDYVGLSLGFAQRSEANYLRLPLWMLWIFDPVIDKDRIAERVDYINRSRNTGKYECSVIARHDNWNMRAPIYEALKDKISILCAGQWNNNTNILWDEYKDDKIKFLNNCKFTICAENEDTPDYVTEKLFEAFLGGCVPIYAGGASNPEPGVVNPEAVLLWERGNKENNDAVVKKVCELNANEALYAEFLSRTKLLPYTVDYVYDTFLQLKKRLEALERERT